MANSIEPTSAGAQSHGKPMAHNQFELLRQRRFLPFFLTAALGAFNDNVFRNAMLGLVIVIGLSNEQVALYANLAPALFILPYFLFSATAGHIAGGVVPDRPAVGAVRAGEVFDPAAGIAPRGTDRRQWLDRDGHLHLDSLGNDRWNPAAAGPRIRPALRRLRRGRIRGPAAAGFQR